MNYGKRLREKRIANDLTQEELADRVSALGHKITSSYISMMERGYDKKADGEPTRPNRRFVELAASVLGDDVDEALMDADYAPINRDRFLNDNDGLYSGLAKHSPEDQKRIRRQMQAILDAWDPEPDAPND